MDDINTLFYNSFGIGFQWKRCAVKDFKKVQLVFRNTGLLLTYNELVLFSNNIKKALKNSTVYKDCIAEESIELLLLQAPNPQTSFAMSYKDLIATQDLIQGVLFQLGLDHLLKDQMIKY